MSSYPPNNLCVYIYAQAGCMGALIAARNQPTDPNEADYADAAERADFFAQEIDTIWGVGSYTNADLQQIQSAAASLWAGGRSPVPGAAGLTAAGYTGIAQALIAGVKAGTAQIVAEGINPNGCGGGGGGTVTSVTGTVPIIIAGSAASPNVTLDQILTGTSTAGVVPTTYTATIPVCPVGGNPATFVGAVQFDVVVVGRAVGNITEWGSSKLSFMVANNAGTIDTGDTTGTFPSANPVQLQVVSSTSVVVAGGTSLTLGTSGGNITLGLKFPTLAGSPTINWTVYYIPRSG